MEISLDGKATTERCVLALGMFDGMHLGHQVLLKRAKILARQKGIPLVVCTFATHPMQVICPEKCPTMLTTLDERAHLMEALGVDLLCAQPFDKRVMERAPEEYVGFLCQRFHPRFVVVGYNHTYGKSGAGTPALLAALGGALGFETDIVPKITLDGEDVSATVIRGLLSQGQAAKACHMLGRPYMREAVSAGEGSFTMVPNGKQDVPAGVYRVLAEMGGKRCPATLTVTREGHGRSTFGAQMPVGEEIPFFFLHGEPKS